MISISFVKRTMNNKSSTKKIINVLFVSLFLLTTQFASALITVPPIPSMSLPSATSPATQKSGSMVRVAAVNVYNAQIVEQKGNSMSVSFVLTNGVGSQPAVRYAVELLNKNGEIVDETVYPETLNLTENSSISKTVHYVAPSFLAGSYGLSVEARNSDGLPLGSNSAGTVVLQGGNQYVALDSQSCFLTISGNATSSKYTLTHGIDILPSESLILHCTAHNQTSKTVTVQPSFEMHRRTVFGFCGFNAVYQGSGKRPCC